MAQNVEQLLLQVEASTALMRSELQRGEQSLASLENRTDRTAQRMGASFQRIDRSAQQSRIGFQQLGFQLQDVAAQAATGTSALTIFAQQGGQVAFALSQFGGAAGRVGAFLSGPWGIALAAAAVALGVLSKATDDAGNSATNLADSYGEAGAQIDRATGTITGAFTTIKDVGVTALDFLGASLVTFGGNLATIFNKFVELNQRANRFLDDVPGLGTLRRAVGDALTGGPRAPVAVDPLTQIDPSVALFSEAFTRSALARPTRTRTPRAAGSLTRSAREAFDAADARASSFQEVAGRLTASAGQPLQGIRTDLEGLQSTAQRVSDAFGEGFRRAERFSANIADNLAQGIVFGQGIGTALVNSFKAAAAEALASGLFKLFSSALGSFFGSPGIGSALGGLFGGARANGGPVGAGRTYLVGERGPELFTPRAAGSIIPNGAFGGGASEIVVRTEPSPLFVTTVAQVSQQGGAQAAGQVIRRARRGSIMGSMGA